MIMCVTSRGLEMPTLRLQPDFAFNATTDASDVASADQGGPTGGDVRSGYSRDASTIREQRCLTCKITPICMRTAIYICIFLDIA
jgi:hypothetical protein